MASSLSGLLAKQELGVPGARQAVQQAVQQAAQRAEEEQIAGNLIKDHYHSTTIKLDREYHRYFTYARSREFVLIVNVNCCDRIVRSVALWSLKRGCQLWEFNINAGPHVFFELSDNGMLLISHGFGNTRITVLNGQQIGTIPSFNWESIVPIGNRILGCYTQMNRLMTVPLNTYFEERDQTGALLNSLPLRNLNNAQENLYAYNDRFWARLSSGRGGKPACIEVVDRITKTVKVSELPILQQREDAFSSACVVQHRLFYGKYTHDQGSNSPNTAAIGIYDLIGGEIVEEISLSTEGDIHKPTELVSNQHYVVWLDEPSGSEILARLKCLDILSKTVRCVGDIVFNDPNLNRHLSSNAFNNTDNTSTQLNLTHNVLSVVYSTNGSFFGDEWVKKVIDLPSGQLKTETVYTMRTRSSRVPYAAGCTRHDSSLCFSVEKLGLLYLEDFSGKSPAASCEYPFYARKVTLQ